MIPNILANLTEWSCRVTNPLIRVNVTVLDLLRKGSLNGVFWTLVLTGSIGMAIPVALFSYADHVVRQVFLNSSIPQ
jgi:hypothetical protein